MSKSVRSSSVIFLALLLLVVGCSSPTNDGATSEDGQADGDLAGGEEEADGASERFVTLAAGGSEGSWYIGSAVIADLYNNANPESRMTAEPGGGEANMRTLEAGDAQFGYMFVPTAAQALEGEPPYEETHSSIRSIMTMMPSYVHILVREDSGIETFDDLEGKTISPGRQGFTGAQIFSDLVEANGMQVDDMDVEYLDYSDATQMMRDGQLDALLSTSAPGHAPYVELGSEMGIRLLELDEDVISTFTSEFQGWTEGAIPADTYPGIEQEVPTLELWAGLATSSNVADDVVYEVTKLVWENREELASTYPAYEAMTEDDVVTETMVDAIPLHPGAERYWEEEGMLP